MGCTWVLGGVCANLPISATYRPHNIHLDPVIVKVATLHAFSRNILAWLLRESAYYTTRGRVAHNGSHDSVTAIVTYAWRHYARKISSDSRDWLVHGSTRENVESSRLVVDLERTFNLLWQNVKCASASRWAQQSAHVYMCIVSSRAIARETQWRLQRASPPPPTPHLLIDYDFFSPILYQNALKNNSRKYTKTRELPGSLRGPGTPAEGWDFEHCSHIFMPPPPP